MIHTPGPWEHETELQVDYLTAPHFLIGNFHRVEDAVVAKANARLIAAAPDLLDALERTANALGLAYRKEPLRDMAETLAEANAAIKKARGE